MEEKLCPACGSECKKSLGTAPDVYQFACPNCGNFEVGHFDLRQIPWEFVRAPQNRGVLSHAIWMRNQVTPWVSVSADSVATILRQGGPSRTETLDLLERLIGSRELHPGVYTTVDVNNDRAAIGVATAESVMWALQSLRVLGRIEMRSLLGPQRQVSLTLAGWLHMDEIERGQKHSRRAFMAMKYGDPDLEKLYRDHLLSAVRETGFQLYRLDESPPAGLIDVRMRSELRRSRFAIADLTHGNPGAYWEAGFMEGLGKPVIYLCEEAVFGENPTHFDTNHSHHVRWNRSDLASCTEELMATIRATLPLEATAEE